MSDKPWEQQPPTSATPSRIITPTDTITVTIDNRGAAPQAQMRVSRELPRAYVIGIFSALITQLSAEMMQEMMRGIPGIKPGSNPSAAGGANNGSQT